MGDGRVRINTATADELNESLSDIGPEQARLIVAYREDQRALKRYLDQRYPGSRSRSVLYALTVGGSLWLVAHGLGGAVEWFVGRGLERVFGL